ncbi:hypothetical protein [Roseovarius salinarum]|uniref:hypothetical protein n=1 Tax=Roseovarius salinarum TaxID=1981892 RepID=UPI001E33A26C|nr:hypothetical protein [Roseovarius salinarum]
MRRLPGTCGAWLVLAALAVSFPADAAAEDFRLGAPQRLVETGFLEYVLPRFSLKTGVGIDVVGADATAELALAPDGPGKPVFSGQGITWRMRLHDQAHDGAARFARWLASDIGRRTISGYQVDGAPLFTPPAAKAAAEAEIAFEGDVDTGLKLSHEHCGRCHAVSEKHRMNDIGSTPSFFVLRTLPDWDARFQIFYAVNPHPVFTQVEGVTAPFPIDRPSPIVPVEITPKELEDILAYVAELEPADLGDPLSHQ